MARWYSGTAETSRSGLVCSCRLTALVVLPLGLSFAGAARVDAGHGGVEARARHVILDTESSWRCFFAWTPPVFTERRTGRGKAHRGTVS